MKSLCEQVGFGLAKSVTRSIASGENPDEIQDALRPSEVLANALMSAALLEPVSWQWEPVRHDQPRVS